MELTTKKLLVGTAAVFVIGLAFGRWTLPAKVKIEKEFVQVEEKKTIQDVNKELNKNKHTKTITKETKKPDGTVVVVTKTVEDDVSSSNVNKKTKTSDNKSTELKESKETEYDVGSLNIGFLAGIKFSNTQVKQGLEGGAACYGAIVQKQMIGPIGLGAWGLNCGQGGVTLGVRF